MLYVTICIFNHRPSYQSLKSGVTITGNGELHSLI